MNSRNTMIAELKAAGHTDKEIARRMGCDVYEIEELLKTVKVREAIEDAQGRDDGTELYSQDEIKFFIEKMYPLALKVVETVLTKPGSVTATQWASAQWVLQKATAIQEMTKENDGTKIINQFVLSDKAGEALTKLNKEMDDGNWLEKLEASVRELPEGVQ